MGTKGLLDKIIGGATYRKRRRTPEYVRDMGSYSKLKEELGQLNKLDEKNIYGIKQFLKDSYWLSDSYREDFLKEKDDAEILKLFNSKKKEIKDKIKFFEEKYKKK